MKGKSKAKFRCLWILATGLSCLAVSSQAQSFQEVWKLRPVPYTRFMVLEKNTGFYQKPAWVAKPWSVDEMPVFCRIEHRLGEKTKVPFKFRLGSVQYVDWLEGKPGSPVFVP